MIRAGSHHQACGQLNGRTAQDERDHAVVSTCGDLVNGHYQLLVQED
jgi:hypothetical protein